MLNIYAITYDAIVKLGHRSLHYRTINSESAKINCQKVAPRVFSSYATTAKRSHTTEGNSTAPRSRSLRTATRHGQASQKALQDVTGSLSSVGLLQGMWNRGNSNNRQRQGIGKEKTFIRPSDRRSSMGETRPARRNKHVSANLSNHSTASAPI